MNLVAVVEEGVTTYIRTRSHYTYLRYVWAEHHAVAKENLGIGFLEETAAMLGHRVAGKLQ